MIPFSCSGIILFSSLSLRFYKPKTESASEKAEIRKSCQRIKALSILLFSQEI